MPQLHGKNVNIVINFDNYSDRQYRNAFQEYLNYQTGRDDIISRWGLRKIDNKELLEEQSVGLMKFLKKKYPYQLFRETVTLFLTKVIGDVLQEFPEILTSDEMEVQIQVVQIIGREYFGAYDPNICDKEHLYVEYSGFWLIGAIFISWVIDKNIPYQTIKKSVIHELHHHVDNMANKFAYEEAVEEKWKLRAQKIKNFGTLFLYSTILEMRFEGYTEFSSRIPDYFKINKQKILDFKGRLWHLITIKDKTQAEEFYNKELSTDSWRTYNMGNIMCIMIACYFSKDLPEQQTPTAGGIIPARPKVLFEGKQYPLDRLDTFMNTRKDVSIVGITDAVHKKTIEFVNSAGPTEFINTYNVACDYFKISQENRVIWWQLFLDLKKATTEMYERERKQKVKSKGYRV
ncbi:MAG: hypothetical protein ABIJ21_01230 [Nanoarchaeota archaeon]